VSAVRNGVGILDYSPLGKILIHGPDAGELLNRVYVNNLKTLKPGKCRYGLMLSEHGIIFDDGIATRWDEDTFQVGSTSGHAEAVADLLEEWLQCEWVDLDVIVEPVTTQWSTIMVAGPKSRAVLQRLGLDVDLSAAAFGHMEARQGHLGEVPLRIARVSFTGELGFEISVPWSQGASLWRRLLELGQPDGITPFGIESLMVMRIEKGFLHVGSDTDGACLPQDVGFGPIFAKKKGDFIGRRSTMTPEGRREDRRRLVGLEALDEQTSLPIGGHVVDQAFTAPPGRSQGWVTSAAMSPTLGRSIALALIERGPERHGETVKIYDKGRTIAARICAQGFYDPTGERLHVQ
jgi:sarcosine oxidase, subunit alpha